MSEVHGEAAESQSTDPSIWLRINRTGVLSHRVPGSLPTPHDLSNEALPKGHWLSISSPIPARSHSTTNVYAILNNPLRSSEEISFQGILTPSISGIVAGLIHLSIPRIL